MHKPYVYIYVSSVLFLLVGFMLIAMDLAVKSNVPGHVGSVLSYVDMKAPAFQAGAFLLLIGVYHFILGVKVDSCYNKTHKTESNLLEELDI